jgi:hypothetical protein
MKHVIKQYLTCFNVNFTDKLTDFWITLYIETFFYDKVQIFISTHQDERNCNIVLFYCCVKLDLVP